MLLKTFQEKHRGQVFSKQLDSGWDYYIKTLFRELMLDEMLIAIKNTEKSIFIVSQLITASKIKQFKNYQHKLTKTIDWTIENMQSKKGYFCIN